MPHSFQPDSSTEVDLIAQAQSHMPLKVVMSAIFTSFSVVLNSAKHSWWDRIYLDASSNLIGNSHFRKPSILDSTKICDTVILGISGGKIDIGFFHFVEQLEK